MSETTTKAIAKMNSAENGDPKLIILNSKGKESGLHSDFKFT